MNNDASFLLDRVANGYTPVGLDTVPGLRMSVEEPEHLWAVIGEISPPTTHSGVEVRASYVFVDGARAYVGYNREGSVYSGSVEIIDISNPAKPEIVSQALFDDTDVAAVTVSPDGSMLMIAGARDQDRSGFESPAVLEEMILDGDLLTDEVHSYMIPSYVANGMAWGEGWLCVSSGNSDTGGVGAFSLDSANYLELINWDGFKNAQFVADDRERIVALQIGDDAQLHLYEAGAESLVPGHKIDLPAIHPVDGKNTIALLGDLAYVAMGEAGMAALDLNTGETLYALPRPEYVPGGEGAPEDYITNAVAVDDSYVYLANGAGGLTIAELPTARSEELKVLGTWNFQSSANYVAARGDLVFVASGSGGLKILKKTEPQPGSASLAEWRLDEPIQTHEPGDVKDEIGLLHGQAFGDVHADYGMVCFCAYFDGKDDYVEIPGENPLPISGAVSVESWVKVEKKGDWKRILHRGNGDDRGFSLRLGEGKRFTFQAKAYDIKFNASSDHPYEEDTWYHIVGVYDGVDEPRIYVDGILQTQHKNNIATDDGSTRVFLGARVGDHNYSLKGWIDETKVYDYALSSEEVHTHYVNNLAGKNADGSERGCPGL